MSIERRNRGESKRGTKSGMVGLAMGPAIIGGLVATQKERAPAASRVKIEMTGERPAAVKSDFEAIHLDGIRCSGLICQYLELPSGAKIPEKAEVNFLESLKDSWQIKVNKTRELEGEEAARRMSGIANEQLKQYEASWQRHDEHGGINNFRDYVNELASIEREVLTSLDWDAIRAIYRIDDEHEEIAKWKLDKIKSLVSRAHGRSLAAYSLTEVMPSNKHVIRYAEAVIRYGGIEYLIRIPAMGDARDSLGNFQLTEIPIDKGANVTHEVTLPAGDPLLDRYPHADDGKAARRIVLSVNDTLPRKLRLPEHVKDFSTLEQHTTGAILLVIDNIVRAVKELDRQDPDDERLKRITGMDGKTFASVLAAHHYRPTLARKALLEWSKDSNWPNNGGPHRSYHEIAGDMDDRVGTYAKNSYDNYERVDAYFEAIGP